MKRILILAIMIAIKAVFSASDTAFTYLNKSKVSQESKKNRKAKKIKYMIENNHRFFGIIEVGITMAELFAGAYALEVFVAPFSEYLMIYGIQKETAIFVAALIVTIILSYFLLIFGAVLPKRIAKNNPEKTAYLLINTLSVLAIINYPFEKLIRISTRVFFKLFGIKEKDKNILSEKEIKMMILEGRDQGIVDKIEKEILFNTLKFNDITVKKIMRPKEEIDFINIKEDMDGILENIKKYKYTRIPVFEGNRDKVIGILNIKDITLHLAQNKELNIDLKSILREVMFISKDEKIPYAFKTMQANRQSILMVVDEKEKTIGLITMEDILEKLVGKIFDEYGK